MQNHKTLFKKLGDNFQFTLPSKYRKQWKLESGSLIKMHIENDKLIIEPAIDNKVETLSRLHDIFKELDNKLSFAENEEEVIKTVIHEIKENRGTLQ